MRTIKYDWSPGVLIVFVLMLIAGWGMRASMTGLVNSYESEKEKLKFMYPGGWAVTAGIGYTLNEFLNMNDADVRMYLVSQPPYENSSFGIGFLRNTENQGNYLGYRRLGGKETTVGGQPGYEIEFAYVDLSRDESMPPRVFFIKETLVLRNDRLLIFSVAAPESKYNAVCSTFDQVLNTVQFGK